MIEAIVIAYLADALPCPVSGTVPPNPPETFVVVEKTGGSRVNRLDGATLAVQSYAPSIAQAAALNLQVKAAMEAIVSLDSVSSCDLETDYNYTDTTRDRPRYQAVFDVVYYEEE
jgi:hypothetical protein